tara:strand:+ start:6208 stop:7167 length:960 start_codon:yes stop_codon:yes gene_type:complete
LKELNSDNKILWVHNFTKGKGKGGIWMFNQQELLQDRVDLYYAYGLRNPLNIVKHYFILRKLCKQYELVHAQYGSAVGFLVGLLNHTKILTLRGSDWYKTKTNNWKDKLRIFLGYHFTRFSLFFQYKQLIVVSNRFKFTVLEQYPKLVIHVFTTPIDLKKFHPIPYQGKRQVKNVLFASVKLDNPVKRYDLAKRSFDLLKEKMPNVNWYVMNNISHEAVNEFINNADLILICSTHEGWPNVLKEALACNVPFVSTDISDMKVIAQQTESCVVCDANEESLSEGMFKVLSTGKSEDLRCLVEEYDIKNQREILENIYQKI